MSLIDIASTKQFFIDDYLIESLINAKQALNPAQKSIHNPIIQSDRPWEGNCNVAHYAYFDEAEGIFKMWYTITTRGLAHVVSWNGASDLSHLQGKTVKLRIYLKHAKLYSFQFR